MKPASTEGFWRIERDTEIEIREAESGPVVDPLARLIRRELEWRDKAEWEIRAEMDKAVQRRRLKSGATRRTG